jgi:hypothetical protein
MKLVQCFGVIAFVLCGCSERNEQPAAGKLKKNNIAEPLNTGEGPIPNRITKKSVVESSFFVPEDESSLPGSRNAGESSVPNLALETSVVFEPIPMNGSSIPTRFQQRIMDRRCPSLILDSGFVFSFEREDGALLVKIDCGNASGLWAAVLPHANCFTADSPEEIWVIMKWFSFCRVEDPPSQSAPANPLPDQESVDPIPLSPSVQSRHQDAGAAEDQDPHDDNTDVVISNDPGDVGAQNIDDVEYNRSQEASNIENVEKEEEEENYCVVCLDKMQKNLSAHEELKLSRCKHRFHTACILEWLDTNRTCPLCRESPSGLVVCMPVSGEGGLGFSYIHPSEGLILAIVCEGTGEVAGPVGPWDDSGLCPDRITYLRLGIEAEIEKRCPPVWRPPRGDS